MLFPLLRCSPFCFLILESCLVFGVFFALELLQVPPSMHSYNFCSRNAVLLTRPMHRQDGAPTRHITLKTRPTQRLLQSGKCSKVYSLLGLPLVQKCRYVLLGGFNCELVPCNHRRWSGCQSRTWKCFADVNEILVFKHCFVRRETLHQKGHEPSHRASSLWTCRDMHRRRAGHIFGPRIVWALEGTLCFSLTDGLTYHACMWKLLCLGPKPINSLLR